MRIVYFVILILAVVNLGIYSLGLLIGENIYKKYGQNILKCFGQILMFFIAIYIALMIAGLV